MAGLSPKLACSKLVNTSRHKYREMKAVNVLYRLIRLLISNTDVFSVLCQKYIIIIIIDLAVPILSGGTVPCLSTMRKKRTNKMRFQDTHPSL